MPMRKRVTSMKVPPYEMKGIGRPITGSMQRFMPAFWKVWAKNMVPMPTTSSRPTWSRD